MPKIAYTMEARKLLYTVMAVAPALLMAGIGIHARTYVDPYDWPSFEDDHVRTKAYIPLALETSQILRDRNRSGADQIREIASKWVAGANDGVLKPLVPVSMDEYASPGHKAKIVNTNNSLAKKLITIADSEIQVGNYDQAARDLCLASESMAGLKYSNFLTLYRVNLAQGIILHRVERIYSRLGRASQRQIEASMSKMVCLDQKVSQLTRLTKRLIQGEERLLQETHAAELESEIGPTTGLFEQPASAKGDSTLVDNFEFAWPNLTLEAQQCLAADQRNRLMIQRIMSLSPHAAS